MTFNLLQERWIGARRASGRREQIRPVDLANDYQGDPFVALASPRPDFDGSLIQFIIGLLQIGCPPKNLSEWGKWYLSPPSPGDLAKLLAHVEHAFDLDGDGPRFEQDIEPIEADPKPIANLLIDSPGDNSLSENKDHFVHRGRISSLCPACTAATLFTMQTNAPAGGAGHRTSVRGGGPLTTLVLGATLWQTVWLNVLDQSNFKGADWPASDLSQILPWLTKTRTSGPQGSNTTPVDVHPLQCFWGMPRRIRLSLANRTSGTCSLCAQLSSSLISEYMTVNQGTNYQGAWVHPLSPYTIDKADLPLAVHAQPGGLTYRHWLAMTLGDANGKRQAAQVVTVFDTQRHQGLKRVSQGADGSLRLWAFGYDMDNMKARCWYETRMPLILTDHAHRQDFEFETRIRLEAAEQIASNLRSAIKNAWLSEKKSKDGNIGTLTPFSGIAEHFWQQTEAAFFDQLQAVREALESNGDRISLRETWLVHLCKTSERMFDERCLLGIPIGNSDPKAIVQARRRLYQSNRSKAVREKILHLPAKQGSATVPQTGEPA